MSVESDLYDKLRATAAVTAIVPQARITPVKRLQEADLPAITYERVTNTPIQNIAGDTSDCDQVRMRVNCWAMTYAQTKTLSAAVRTAVATMRSYFISDQDLYEDDTQIHRVALDFYIWTN